MPLFSFEQKLIPTKETILAAIKASEKKYYDLLQKEEKSSVLLTKLIVMINKLENIYKQLRFLDQKELTNLTAKLNAHKAEIDRKIIEIINQCEEKLKLTAAGISQIIKEFTQDAEHTSNHNNNEVKAVAEEKLKPTANIIKKQESNIEVKFNFNYLKFKKVLIGRGLAGQIAIALQSIESNKNSKQALENCSALYSFLWDNFNLVLKDDDLYKLYKKTILKHIDLLLELKMHDELNKFINRFELDQQKDYREYVQFQNMMANMDKVKGKRFKVSTEALLKRNQRHNESACSGTVIAVDTKSASTMMMLSLD